MVQRLAGHDDAWRAGGREGVREGLGGKSFYMSRKKTRRAPEA